MKIVLFSSAVLLSIFLFSACNIFGGSSSNDAPGNYKNQSLTDDAIIPDYEKSFSAWGLGSELSLGNHNDVEYAWYMD